MSLVVPLYVQAPASLQILHTREKKKKLYLSLETWLVTHKTIAFSSTSFLENDKNVILKSRCNFALYSLCMLYQYISN